MKTKEIFDDAKHLRTPFDFNKGYRDLYRRDGTEYYSLKVG